MPKEQSAAPLCTWFVFHDVVDVFPAEISPFVSKYGPGGQAALHSTLGASVLCSSVTYLGQVYLLQGVGRRW